MKINTYSIIPFYTLSNILLFAAGIYAENYVGLAVFNSREEAEKFCEELKITHYCYCLKADETVWQDDGLRGLLKLYANTKWGLFSSLKATQEHRIFITSSYSIR